MTASTLYQEVLDDFAEHARTGEPFTHWTCGRCGRDGNDGVRMFVREVELEPARGGRRRVVDFPGSLVCPCCSFAGCPHVGLGRAVQP